MFDTQITSLQKLVNIIKLVNATKSENVEEVKAKLKELQKDPNFDINAKDKDGRTALHYAAFHGTPETVQALIAVGADVNAKDKDGLTPLHDAAFHGTPETVQALIDAGADVNAKGYADQTPLHYAAGYYGKPETVQALIAAGADVNAKDNKGRTAEDILKERIAEETDPTKKAELKEALNTKPNASSTLGKNSGGDLTQAPTRQQTVQGRETR